MGVTRGGADLRRGRIRETRAEAEADSRNYEVKAGPALCG